MKEQPGQAPHLLVSVRDASECAAAIAGGADWIDLKEPNDGPLAAVSLETAREVVSTLAGQRKLSAALGELHAWHDSPARELLEVPGIQLVKLGLAGCGKRESWREDWLDVQQHAASQEKQLVTVVYADWQRADTPPPSEVLELAARSGSKYLLIDTFVKDGSSTFDFFPSGELEEILLAARQRQMKTVLAGSITGELLERVPAELVDIVAVRGAVCRGDRTAIVDQKLVQRFRLTLCSLASDSSAVSCPTA